MLARPEEDFADPFSEDGPRPMLDIMVRNFGLLSVLDHLIKIADVNSAASCRDDNIPRAKGWALAATKLTECWRGIPNDPEA